MSKAVDHWRTQHTTCKSFHILSVENCAPLSLSLPTARTRFTIGMRELFPSCPAGTEQLVAEHASLRYSGRVGRSAAAKALGEKAVQLAVVAHIRHVKTSYDKLLAEGWDRHEARRRVAHQVQSVLDSWQRS